MIEKPDFTIRLFCAYNFDVLTFTIDTFYLPEPWILIKQLLAYSIATTFTGCLIIVLEAGMVSRK